MDNLRDLLKKFVEMQRGQDKDDGNGSMQDKENLPNLEEKIQDAGYNPDEIREFVDTFSPDEDINKIVEDIFKVIGKEVTFRKPTRVTDDGFVSKSIFTKETEQGLERTTETPLIVASCGKVIKEEEIGVRCSVPTCNQYDCKEHAFVCHSCGNGLCIRHVRFFQNEKGENIPHCPACFREQVLNQYLW